MPHRQFAKGDSHEHNTFFNSARHLADDLLLMGHGSGLHKDAPGLVSQARRAVAGDGSGNGSGDGFTVSAIDAPGHVGRPRSDQDQRQVDAIRRAPAAGERA